MTREADQREASDGASGEERSASREADQREASNGASGEKRSASREAAADAASALVFGAAVSVVVRRRGVPFSLRAAVAGAVGALLVEGILSRYRTRVRALWERPRVRWGATAGGAAAAVVAAPRAPGRALWALLGGVGTYLLVLAGATRKSVANASR